MNVMILGAGGREHALTWKLANSEKLTRIFNVPGNAGTSLDGINIKINHEDFSAIAMFCIRNNIEMVVVGPEAPLVKGLKNYFKKHSSLRQIKFIGPDKKAALLEGSKSFAKEFMKENNIPTAAYISIGKSEKEKGKDFIEAQKAPFVIKADGLAGGKGVIICDKKKEAFNVLDEMLDGKFGDASKTVVIEEFLNGIEMSVFVLTDGKNYQILPEAKDYKRVGDKDTGLNTGGMGAVSPVPFATKELKAKIEQKIIKPTVKGLKSKKYDYKGFIFFGLMIVENEPYVIEYNVRLGDPEAEVVLPRIESDLLQHLIALSDGKLKNEEIVFSNQSAATVMLTSGGYPEKYEKGKIITGTDNVTESHVFHAGVALDNDKMVTSGGRVIALTSLADSFKKALEKSYKSAKIVDFEKKYYRKDIGYDL